MTGRIALSRVVETDLDGGGFLCELAKHHTRPWERKQAIAIRLGDTAPDFTAETTEGTINFHQWISDSWVATPVNWRDGDDCIIVPTITDEEAKEKFPDGWKTLKPYLRIVKQPSA